MATGKRETPGPVDAPFAAGAALEFIERRFGGPCRAASQVVTVGTSVINVISRDNERVSLTFVNLGTTTIFLDISGTPSTTRGMRMGPSGGTITVNLQDDSLLPTEEWNGIGDAAAGTLYVLTVRRETRTRAQEGG